MGIEIVGHDGKANSDLAKKIVRKAFQNGVIVEIGGNLKGKIGDLI